MRAGLLQLRSPDPARPSLPAAADSDPLENPVRCACACNAEGGAGCRRLSLAFLSQPLFLRFIF